MVFSKKIPNHLFLEGTVVEAVYAYCERGIPRATFKGTK